MTVLQLKVICFKFESLDRIKPFLLNQFLPVSPYGNSKLTLLQIGMTIKTVLIKMICVSLLYKAQFCLSFSVAVFTSRKLS